MSKASFAAKLLHQNRIAMARITCMGLGKVISNLSIKTNKKRPTLVWIGLSYIFQFPQPENGYLTIVCSLSGPREMILIGTCNVSSMNLMYSLNSTGSSSSDFTFVRSFFQPLNSVYTGVTSA